MRFFLLSFSCVVLLSGLSGYYALYTPKFSRPSNVYVYPNEYLKAFDQIELAIIEKRYDEALLLCNEAILSATDKRVVAKSYFLRSKIYYKNQDIENAKKDLLYAKEIDFETFSSKAAYSFIKSLRELQLYESELFSGAKKDLKKELIYSIYYGVVLICLISLIILLKTAHIPQRKGLLYAENS